METSAVWLGMQSEPSMGVKDMAWLSAGVACLVAAALPQLEQLVGQPRQICAFVPDVDHSERTIHEVLLVMKSSKIASTCFYKKI